MTRERRIAIAASALCVAALFGCMQATANAAGQPLRTADASRPTLVVLITVDQLRGDMLDRYRADLRYGYARLMRGAWFVNAFQDHALTETAPGHASTLSGRFPRSTEIVSNTMGVGDRNFRLLTGLANERGASPLRFQGTTLFDWIFARDKRARAVSVSRKDRGAILPIGRAKQDVYWLSASGDFTTSDYYRDSLPGWVQRFNARRILKSYAGGAWRLSRPETSYPEPDSVPFEAEGHNFTFPHRFPADSLGAASYARDTPTADSVTAVFALEAVRSTGIGRGPQTDVLAVSFSATDAVGHEYGPDSREAHENEIRLDETIGWFLDSLYAMRDSANIVIALTADHGVSPIPEIARERGLAKGFEGLRVPVADEVAAVRTKLTAAGVDPRAFYFEDGLVIVDRAALAAAKVNRDSLIDDFARTLRAMPGIARVDRMTAIRRADFAADPIARRWSHQFPAALPVEIVATLTRYSTWWTTPANHGSPYDQDASVPIIFYGPWVKPGRYTTFARVVDLGVTLAAIAGVQPLEKVDGVVLTEALAR